LKTNMDLGRAVLTGCLRAAKESIFTGLNNLLVCSILDSGDDDISSGIGFTKEEAEEVLSYYGLTDYYGLVGDNYDGYYFGDVHMYCPWDVMSFCYGNYKAVGKENKNITAGNYWINTSGNDVIEEFMGFIEPEDVELMQDLLDGKSITAEVRATLCYGDLQNHDINDFWTLLLYTGYLTFEPQSHNPESDEYSVYIPNEEIRKCFKSRILNYFKNNSVMKSSTAELVKGLFEGDAEKVQDNLNTLLGKYVSIRDFATNAPKENYYHGFMNGLLVNGTSFIEEHKSNFESGDGYVDIIIASKNSDTVAILELKHTDKPFGARLIAAEKALEQITERGYPTVYVNDPLVRNVYAYGICFYKKLCSVVTKKMK
ncbi:PD-(D/E)XK nuclease domain-containing protein, partial [uncultured Ruminobacter sp.]|uniref:PD-(D/E)XK nuclease domain-containing protein n=1 Tax=uncultured Ruminobacter sp. TaxID=538947 RepID=UPI00261B7F7C